ncbi:GyrI-like domain-containing protein [Brachybacterium sp. YJGR34]|uniref:GyrI-like domain-containing protein n=1 Tax=Brachybacterium sp. YJGR34 TaxID=2059911 RepID=UPI000E0AE45C|nr:GyrI-like domain-containing protein [Brachybacterium sp. YJGR34]
MSDRPFDAKRDLDHYRARRGTFRFLDIPLQHYLMVDGAGDPNASPAYQAALAALYPLAYRLKFLSARELGQNYVVPPLEGLWWAEDMAAFTTARDKSRWQWRLMIMTPEWIRAEHVEAARTATGTRAEGSAGGPPVRWEPLTEGLCVQTLHVGPYDAEGPVLERMHHEVIPEAGRTRRGTHHEIYLGDPRRSAPERLRTILRQPVG